jgi:hypothetical protein
VSNIELQNINVSISKLFYFISPQKDHPVLKTIHGSRLTVNSKYRLLSTEYKIAKLTDFDDATNDFADIKAREVVL